MMATSLEEKLRAVFTFHSVSLLRDGKGYHAALLDPTKKGHTSFGTLDEAVDWLYENSKTKVCKNEFGK